MNSLKLIDGYTTQSVRRPALLVLLMTIASFWSFCQGLEAIPPVQLDTAYAENEDSSTSFMLNALDFHSFAKKGEQVYSSAIEIIDADQPWPPRWYTAAPFQLFDRMTGFEDMYMDARVQQNGQFTFYTREAIDYAADTDIHVNGYIICNEKLEPVDTFKGGGLPLNYHEFRINSKGEKLVMGILDTSLDISPLSRNPADTAMNATIDIIEIFDSMSKLIFQWNPVKSLGVKAFHWYYRWDHSFSSKPGYLDWSHGNAADWDFDGNIIYSFRNIGIGKISRSDGHIIWRFDRNEVPFISGNDTIAFYMQHGLEKVSDNAQYTTYEMYSNGDYVHHSRSEPDHPGACGLLFRVSKQNHTIHLVKKKKPHRETLSLSAGNYEVEKNGDYLISYGYQAFRKQIDSNGAWHIMEYGNKIGQIYGIYNMPVLIVPYKIHRLNGWRPPRPDVKEEGDMLSAWGDMNDWNWYQLTWPYKNTVTKVGEGQNFVPKIAGIYFVTGKYGLGYSVSLPVYYKL